MATWGFWIDNTDNPYNGSHACDRHLGEMLPVGSSHHTNGARINIWSLCNGYDGTMYSKEEIAAATGQDELNLVLLDKRNPILQDGNGR